jgi:hypothetical protein
VAEAAVILALALAAFFVFGLFQDCLEAWQNGKAKVKQLELEIEREKTKQAELGNNSRL